MPQIEKEYVTTGKVKYVSMDFPLESIHKQALKLAEIAHCAGEQGKYWEMHDQFFTNQRTLKPENWEAYGQVAGVEKLSFQQCIDSGRHASEIRKDMAEGQKAGVRSIPTFLLGFTEPDGKVKAVKMITGAQPYASFKEAIDTLLSQK